MHVALLLALLATPKPTVAFCPLAPSPIRYRDNLSLRIDKNGHPMNEAYDARSVSRLVDTSTNSTVGWLYLDAVGHDYVVLKPYQNFTLYVDFGMIGFNRTRPGIVTQPTMQVPFRLPPGIEIDSCL